MGLDEFVETIRKQAGQTEQGKRLAESGPFCRQLALSLRDHERAASLIANNFWQSFLASPAIYDIAQLANQNPMEMLYSEKLVVHNGDRRFDLMIFMNSQVEPRALRAKIELEALAKGWQQVANSQHSGGWRQLGPVAMEALQAGQPFSIILAPKQPTLLTSKLPNPALSVGGASGNCSVGAIVKNKSRGTTGITTAYHAIGSTGTLTVAGMTGTLQETDTFSDSCLIELPSAPSSGSRGAGGVMSGKLPRGHETAEFDSIVTGGMVSTPIIAWSMELPDCQPHYQLKVYTNDDTNPGDSGSALITPTDDCVVGFAHELSSGTIKYSSWMWAELVYMKLGVEDP
jgi:hypothetical protein